MLAAIELAHADHKNSSQRQNATAKYSHLMYIDFVSCVTMRAYFGAMLVQISLDLHREKPEKTKSNPREGRVGGGG